MELEDRKQEMSADQYWAVCQMMSGQERKVRAEIEKMERGTFLPAFMRLRVSRGRKSNHALASMPGYVFFQTDALGWSQVRRIEGVHRVLASGESAVPVRSEDMMRMIVQDYCGDLNDAVVTAAPAPAAVGRRRSRKPRPSKRARVAAKADAVA